MSDRAQKGNGPQNLARVLVILVVVVVAAIVASALVVCQRNLTENKSSAPFPASPMGAPVVDIAAGAALASALAPTFLDRAGGSFASPPTLPTYTYYDAWRPMPQSVTSAENPLPIPNATVITAASMRRNRQQPGEPIQWQSPNYCFYNADHLTCGCSSYTPQGYEDDFNCTNAVQPDAYGYDSNAKHTLCPYRGMNGATPLEPDDDYACTRMGRAESQGGSGECGCDGSRKLCHQANRTCTLDSWNPDNKPACCAGVVDTFYAQTPWELGINQTALICDPTWYVGSDVCDAQFSASCMGPVVTQAAVSAGFPHPFLYNNESFPCNDYYNVIRAWAQMGNPDGAPATAAIADEVLRFCQNEGRSDPSCVGVVHDFQLPS